MKTLDKTRYPESRAVVFELLLAVVIAIIFSETMSVFSAVAILTLWKRIPVEIGR